MGQVKLPAFQFYVGDWLKDPALRAVSIESRGLWIDALCLMHESPRRGYLQHENGKPVTTEQLARMTGCSSEQAAHMVQELEDAGVFSRSEHGVIYSRRMVRDEHKRQLCADAGKRGGGNPTFIGASKGGAKGQAKGIPPPSSSSSVSSSPSGRKKPPTPLPDIPPELDTPGFRAAWGEWLAYRRETKGAVTPRAAREQFADIAKFGPEAGIEAIRLSIKNDWTGLFPEKCNGTPSPNRQTTPPAGADNRRAQARAAEFGGGDVGAVPVFRG